MRKVLSKNGSPLWVFVQPDPEFDEYGYYYEIFGDENGDNLIDYGDTYDKDEERSLELACNLAKEINI